MYALLGYLGVTRVDPDCGWAAQYWLPITQVHNLYFPMFYSLRLYKRSAQIFNIVGRAHASPNDRILWDQL